MGPVLEGLDAFKVWEPWHPAYKKRAALKKEAENCCINSRIKELEIKVELLITLLAKGKKK